MIMNEEHVPSNAIYIKHVREFLYVCYYSWSLAAFHNKYQQSQYKAHFALFCPPLFYYRPSLALHSFKYEIQNIVVILLITFSHILVL